MPDSEAKRQWMAQNTTFIGLKLNNNTDTDILAAAVQAPLHRKLIHHSRSSLVSVFANTQYRKSR